MLDSQQPKVLDEIISLRSERAKVFLLSNGQRRAIFHGKPIHYKSQGAWTDIEIDLVESANEFAVDKNKVKTHFRKDKKLNRYISLRYDPTHQLDLSLISVKLDAAEKVSGSEFDQLRKTGKGRMLHRLASGVEVITELNEISARGFVKVDNLIGDFTITEEIDLRGLTCSNAKSGNQYIPDTFGKFNFVDQNNELMFWIAPPSAIDADEKRIRGIDHTLTELPGPRLLYTKYPTAQGKLELAAAVYPLLIDTDIFYSTTKDGWVESPANANWGTARNAGTGAAVNDTDQSRSGVASVWFAGTYVLWRGFFYFDTSALPDDAAVNAAVLKLYGFSYADSDVSAQKGTQAATLTTADYDAFEGAGGPGTDGREYGHVNWSTGTYNSITFNATGESDISLTGTTKICIREYTHDYSDSAPGTYYDNGCYFTEYTGTDRDPRLEVDYTVPFQQQLLSAATIPSATIIKKQFALLAATTTGLATIIKKGFVILSATATGVATLVSFAKKILAATTVPASTIIKKTTHTLAATSAGLATLSKQRTILLAATATGTAALINVAKKLLVATTTPVSTILTKMTRGRHRYPLQTPPRWPTQMRAGELEDIGYPGFDYKVFPGVAPDAYQGTFINIGFMCKMINCRIWDNPAEIIFSYDGKTAVSEEYVEQGFSRMKMVRGFMIRNFIPGMMARYQFTFFR